MDDVDLKDISFYVMFVVLYFLVPWIVVKASYDKRFKFDLSDLWLYKDRIDKLAVILMVTWWIHTSSMILWTLLRQVTTADQTTYMGWAIPIMLKILGQAFGNGHSTAPSIEPPKQP